MANAQADSAVLSTSQARAALAEIVTWYGWDIEDLSVKQLTDLGVRLSELADKSPAWSWRYMRSVLSGSVGVSRDLSRAILQLAALFDGVPLQQVQAVSVTVVVLPGVIVEAGALALVSSRRCDYVACRKPFIPRSTRQRFHTEECRRVDQNLKRKKRGV